MRRRALATAIVVVALADAGVALASVALTQTSTDPFTNTTSQHRTEVEADSYAVGSTIVGAFQVGRFYDGGASDIGWTRSTNGGASWGYDFLGGITKYRGNGPYDRVSDPAVAYDAAHGVWLISSLALTETPNVKGAAVIVNRSSDGRAWSGPVTVASAGPNAEFDKDWIACDDTAASPFYGRCYVEWDVPSASNGLIRMSTSTDGGLTWGAARSTADAAGGIGGEPVVAPNGSVVVPIDNAAVDAVLSFRSTNGGASWSSSTRVASVTDHAVAGGLRAPALLSAGIDGGGKVYIVWQDCRFRSNCSANDIVMSTSTDGSTWSAVVRIPIDGTASGVDHFIPGLGVDRATAGTSAHLGLVYYDYPSASCTSSTCRLGVGFVSSPDGGATWTAPTQLTAPMQLSWLADTDQGRMVGDYASTSFSAGKAFPLLTVALAPSSGSASSFHEAMYVPAGGLAATTAVVPVDAAAPVLSTTSDHRSSALPRTQR
jgi:hypothetical protein